MGETLDVKCGVAHGKDSCTGLPPGGGDDGGKEDLAKDETEDTAELETGEGPLVESDKQDGQGGANVPEQDFAGERKKSESVACATSLLAPLVVGLVGVFYLA